MIKTIIVEDEKKSREVLQKLLKEYCPNIEIAGTAASMKEGIQLADTTNPDLIFLDIELGDGTGFELLEKTKSRNTQVIFATAYDKYALKAIKYSAIDYILKPYDIEELKSATSKIQEKKQDASGMDNIRFLLESFRKQDDGFTRITLPTGNAFEVVNVGDIIRCEADGSYTVFFLNGNKKIMVTQSLKHYEELLPENKFVRIHHHHLINIEHVTRFLKEDSGYAIMSDGTKVEVSRRKRDAFLEMLQKPR